AVSHASSTDIEELSLCMDRLSRAMATRENLGDTDASFHKKLFEISHNRFLREVFDVVFDGLEVLWKSPLGLDTFGDAGLPLHRDLYEAIRERNLDVALEIYDRIINLDRKDIMDLTGYKPKSQNLQHSITGVKKDGD
ncbi:MAG TPA: FCD domain-containing protein, partial [Mesotoga infera]|nr:FCD domain-containing protein [Mesotoga infera]